MKSVEMAKGTLEKFAKSKIQDAILSKCNIIK